MYGLSTPWLVAGVLGLLVLVFAGVAWYYYRQYAQTLEEGIEEIATETEDGELLFEAPTMSTPLFDFVRVMRHREREKKMAAKGYVKWYRLGATLSRPRWVKPTLEGTGVPEFEVKGHTYFFPKESMVTDSLTGAYVAIHPEGEGNPINLRQPAYPGMMTDLIERVANLKAEDTPPGMLSNLPGNLSTQTMIYGGMALLFVIYAAYWFMSGGSF